MITGTGRSGSAYIAELLTQAGVPCGKEQWWGAGNEPQQPGLVGDSSCCALPLGLDDFDGLVYHQVRHPLAVVSSMVRAPVLEPHLGLFRRLVPGVDPRERVRFALQWWLACCREGDRLASRWWRVDQVDADLLIEIGAAVGVTVSPESAQTAIDSVPRNFNHHGGRWPHALTWEEICDYDRHLGNELVRRCEFYGFAR